MQATDLKFPGGYTHAKTIRREVAHTISQLEDAAVYGPADPAFADFLMDAAAKTPGYVAPEAPVTPMPATRAMVDHDVTTQILDYRGANAYQAFGKLAVENNKLLAVMLLGTHCAVKNGQRFQLNNVQYTFTVANGQITAIAAVPF